VTRSKGLRARNGRFRTKELTKSREGILCFVRQGTLNHLLFFGYFLGVSNQLTECFQSGAAAPTAFLLPLHMQCR
jgi:hypothetical protein